MTESSEQQQGPSEQTTASRRTPPSSAEKDRRSAKLAFGVLIPVSLFFGIISAFAAEGQCVDSCNNTAAAIGIIGGWGSIAVAYVIGLGAELLLTTGRNRRPMAPWAWTAAALPVAGAVFAGILGSIAAS